MSGLLVKPEIRFRVFHMLSANFFYMAELKDAFKVMNFLKQIKCYDNIFNKICFFLIISLRYCYVSI